MTSDKLIELAKRLLLVKSGNRERVFTAIDEHNINLSTKQDDGEFKDAGIITFFPEYNTIGLHKSHNFMGKMTEYVEYVDTVQSWIDNDITVLELEKTTLTDIVEGLKNGTYSIDLKNHNIGFNGNNEPYQERIKDDIIRNFQHELDGANGKFDNTWSEREGKSKEDVNKSMREFYSFTVNREVEVGEKLRIMSDLHKCSCCGEGFNIILGENNTITLGPAYYHLNEGKLDITCPIGIPSHTTGKIEVTSELIIANFFRILDEKQDGISDDAPKDMRYSDEYSLNDFAGRRNVTKHKAETHNVAYGQMGNMGMSVYVNEDKTKVILTECFIESDKKLETLKNMGFTLVNDHSEYISLSMWRWEATDINTLLKQNNYNLEENTKESLIEAITEDVDDIALIDVAHGTWKFTHYYDTTPDPEDEDELFVYAELNLVKESNL
jgi:hypothetical protein